MTYLEPSGEIKRYVGLDWPKPNYTACKEHPFHLDLVTNLLHFDGGFDLGHILFHVSLQSCDVNRLANGPRHVQDYRMYKISKKERKKTASW